APAQQPGQLSAALRGAETPRGARGDARWRRFVLARPGVERRCALAQRARTRPGAPRSAAARPPATPRGIPADPDPAVCRGPVARPVGQCGAEALGSGRRTASARTGHVFMNADEGWGSEDLFADLLAGCDEALAAGGWDCPPSADVAPELRARLERGVNCLRW